MRALVDDRYELLEVLASGGMATVWRARDTRLERLVALKRPHPAPAESKLHERMGREARAAAGVNHPNLVTMFDTGTDEDGPYLVMEMVDGPTLSAPGREIGPSEAVAIGAQIADALAAVHEAGIVHRDVKPANVILSDRGPCLTDFGLASMEETRDLTQPGTIMATPSFAAPEVLAGDSPSAASDVFSLSALVYGLLKGMPPYEGTDRASSPQKLDDPFVDAVIRSGLAIDPGQRPSARDLAASLRAGAPTQAMAAAHDTLVMSGPIDLGPKAGEVAPPDATATTALPILPIEDQRSFPPEPGSPVPPPRTAEPVPMKAVEEPADRRRTAAVVVALVVMVVALAAWAIRSPADPAADSPTTNVTVTAPASTTTPTTLPVDSVGEARERLAAILVGIGPPELKPKERDEILEEVDDAIVLVSDDPGEAEEAIKKAGELISEKLGGSAEGEALAALVDLAAAMGIDFSPKDDDGD